MLEKAISRAETERDKEIKQLIHDNQYSAITLTDLKRILDANKFHELCEYFGHTIIEVIKEEELIKQIENKK
jgi:hypothetical protein